MPSFASHLTGGDPLDANHHQANAKISVCFSIAVGLIALIVRMLSRWPWRELLDKDDIIVFVSTVRICSHIESNERR